MSGTRKIRLPLRSLLRDMTPPLLLHLLHGEPIRTRVFDSWAQALAASGEDYENQSIVDLVDFRTGCFRRSGLTELPLSVLQSATAVAIAAEGRDRIRVIEFGGACGICYYQLKRLFPQLCFDWRVVETTEMAAAGTRSHASEELSFHSELEAALRGMDEVDLVHSSSTLGFLENSHETLAELLHVNSRYLLISRVCLVEGAEDFIVLHRPPLSINGYGSEVPPGFRNRMVSYPVRLISRNRLEHALTEYGNILFRCDDSSALLPCPGLKLSGRSYFVRRRP